MSKPIPLIQKFMSTGPHFATPDQTLADAHRLMLVFDIRHLPVVSAGSLVGLVTERDLLLLESMAEVDPEKTALREVMSDAVYAVSPDAPLDEVASTMAQKKYGCAVVMQNGKVVGVFTTVDLCRALAELLQHAFGGVTRAAFRRAGVRTLTSILLGLLLSLSARGVNADEGLTPLLALLATSAARFEFMLNVASFTVALRVDSLDRDGTVNDTKNGVFRLTAGTRQHSIEVIHYSENGEDQTAAARRKAREAFSVAPDPDDEVHLPFLASEQPKYAFRVGEGDPRDANRVRVYFQARKPSRTLFNGSAWVDRRSGEVLSMGVIPSKTALFVDRIALTLVFGAPTKLGAGVSKIAFEGEGGFWFFRRRFRGTASLSEYALP